MITTKNLMVSIGVLAHNEESQIGRTLESLFLQDVFQCYQTELVIVANGCSDATGAVARRSLEDHQKVWSVGGSARVDELVMSGKANAWNEYVHHLSAPHAYMLVLMDADIGLLETNTISSLISTLECSSRATVCVDRPVKDIEFKSNRTIFERLLVAATPAVDVENAPLCGQLYCALSSRLRQIKLPIEIICEDGFLRALLLTDGFTRPENPSRIVINGKVSHSFASVATLYELFRHEKWVVSGNIVNAILFERFSVEAGGNNSAMALMEQWQTEDSDWLPKYIHSQVKARGWDLLPREAWIRRWSRLRKLPLRRMVLRFPISLIASVMDAIVFIAAIRDVRRGRAFHYWGR